MALFGHFVVIDCFGWYWVESLQKDTQLMLEFLKTLFLVLHFSYYISMTFLMMSPLILQSILILLSIKHCDLGQEVACCIQSWKNWTSWFWPVQQHWCYWCENGWFCSWGKSFWGWLSLLNWIRALTLSLLLKLPPRKLEPWFILWNFFPLRLLCISINLQYSHAWNTVVMSGLVLLNATWNC